MRRHNKSTIKFPKLDKRKNGEEVIFAETRVNNFPELDKNKKFQILELK